MLFIDIINNLSLLAALCVVSDVINKYCDREKLCGKVLQGILFGGIAILVMLKPLSLGTGLFFDGRSVIISLSGFFFGPIAAVISAVSAIVCRYIQGGIGCLTGILVIFSAALIGTGFFIFHRKKNSPVQFKEILFLAVIVHVVMLLLMFTLPLNTALGVVRRLGLIILIVYPLAEVIIGKILFDQAAKTRFQKLHEKSLSDYKELVESANSIILRFDTNGEITFCNGFTIDFFGFNRDELLGKNICETIVPKYESGGRDLRNMVEELLKHPEKYAVNDNENVKKNGERVWISWTNKIIFNNENEKEILAMGNDITSLKQSETALKESEEKYKLLLANSPDMVMLADAGGKVIYVGPQAEEIIGYPPEELLNISFPDFIHPDDLERTRIAYENSLIGNEIINIEYRIYDKHKNLQLLTQTTRPVIVDGKMKYIQSNVRNITEIKLLEKEKEKLIESLQQSVIREVAIIEKMSETQKTLNKTNEELAASLEKANEAVRIKTEFMAMMSHEIRTPLSGIIGFSGLLKNESGMSNSVMESIQYLHASASRLNDLLTNILELSSLQSGKEAAVVYSEFDIEKMLNDFSVLFKDKIIKQNIKFKCFIECNKIVHSDPLRMQQILFNLIGNAVKFTNRGDVVVTVSQKNRNYLFEVRDTGIGIESEETARIFDVFSQANSSQFNRKFQGAGIGLSLCKRLVEILGGTISVQSEKNKGSTFRFKIPVPEKVERTPEAIKIVKQDTLSKNIKILFAEDDDINFRFIQKNLENLGVKYKGFYNGRDLFSEFEKDNDYDIILLDIQMPIMNGEECLALIKQKSPKTPVVALTAFSTANDRKNFLSKGFDEFISKPFDKEILSERIKSLLG